MNPKLTIKKLIGHSSNLLTFYLGVVRKYKVLEPMIFSQTVCEKYGSGSAATGFKIIRSSLYYGVVQDVANIVFDSGTSNPSIINVISSLEHKAVVKLLREKYSTEYCPKDEYSKFYKARNIKKGLEFDSHFKELMNFAKSVQNNQEFKAAKSVRDEFTAHLDLQFVNGSYEYPDISKYDLKWNSLNNMITELRPLIEKVGYVIRNADFAWDSFESQNQRISSCYWEPISANK